MKRRLICEQCGKEFFRHQSAISMHNYCSQSCSAIINNIKYPKRPAPIKICPSCGHKFHKTIWSIYCSVKCRIIGQQKYKTDKILRVIKELGNKLGRAPSRRELGEISYGAIRIFGSWNTAIIAAGLTPHRSHDHRMYRRIRTRAHDGHVCDSISEAIIDNWFTDHNISHIRNIKYPTTNHKVDWTIGDNIFVEYFGLSKDSPRYDKEIKIKQKLCQKHQIKLIEIYPSDLYPKVLLKHKLLGR